MSAVVASGAVVPLLNTLELPRDRPAMEAIQERRKLLEATTRALKAIFASSRAIKYDTFTVSFDPLGKKKKKRAIRIFLLYLYR